MSGCVQSPCEETALGSHWLTTAGAAYDRGVHRGLRAVLFWLLPHFQSGLPAREGGADSGTRARLSM